MSEGNGAEATEQVPKKGPHFIRLETAGRAAKHLATLDDDLKRTAYLEQLLIEGERKGAYTALEFMAYQHNGLVKFHGGKARTISTLYGQFKNWLEKGPFLLNFLQYELWQSEQNKKEAGNEP